MEEVLHVGDNKEFFCLLDQKLKTGDCLLKFRKNKIKITAINFWPVGSLVTDCEWLCFQMLLLFLFLFLLLFMLMHFCYCLCL